MILCKDIQDIRCIISKLKAGGKTIGFVPTMGALHNGHLALIHESNNKNDITICSIFVNPTQFNDSKDFEKYPHTIENDIYLLEKENTAILFLPSVKEIYPEGIASLPHYDLGYLETILEGFHRPAHFQGVAQVMHKLLKIISPDDLFMGQKDYQQTMIVKRIIDGFKLGVTLHIISTKREKSGLAMSSRNMRLPGFTIQQASALFKALDFIKNNIQVYPFINLKKEAAAIIIHAGFDEIDYIEICDAATLSPAGSYNNNVELIALTAAFIGGVRLIDNMLLN